jgi:recombinational DNA repair ATPase RecF
MKIKTIKICGFRGIPPVDPPDVDINLSTNTGDPKHLLLFGPNAYGKSSIADALEWFFKENVRGSDYFAEYSDEDNVHVMLGQSNYQTEAYIELLIEHDGHDHTVRKTLDRAGNKINENLAGIQAILQELEDEIIVLDHDQFRKFVSAANTDKWTTFSSLIGFEELDNFRAGIDSLSQRSLTDYLHRQELESEIKSHEKKFEENFQKTIQANEIEVASLDDLKVHFQMLLEVTLASLTMTVPIDDEINSDFWKVLQEKISTHKPVTAVTARLGELNTILGKLSPFSGETNIALGNLNDQAAALNARKEDFDKELLAVFYQTGLKIIENDKAEQGLCPFCLTPFDWEHLTNEVDTRNQTLNFIAIQSDHQVLLQTWNNLRPEVNSRRSNLGVIEITALKNAFNEVDKLTEVDNALALSNFDLDYIQQWTENFETLSEILSSSKEAVQIEITDVTEAIESNPQSEIQQTLNQLQQLWTDIGSLSNDLEHLLSLKNKHDVMKQIIEGLRSITSNFRSELNDFSVRVVEIINADVISYYDELHPDDNVRPYLNVTVRGNQRIVDLQCDYKGVPDRPAVTLLSESHRNSLGLSILLAFMKYKRQTGSSIGFCIFDDVTQSFDVEHRTNLLSLLENQRFPEISDQQIIFMTHDRTLADLIKRPGEQGVRSNWVRMDIRHWWIERMLLESEHDQDPLTRAQEYINQHDEIAAAIYVRRGLEQLYKRIIDKTKMRIPFTEKPWNVSMESYRRYIIEDIEELWDDNKGFIDPNGQPFQQLFTSQRILNLTVHDSQFLDNPMTLGDVSNAHLLVEHLRARFTCACGQIFHTVRKDLNGNNPQCRNSVCHNLLN